MKQTIVHLVAALGLAAMAAAALAHGESDHKKPAAAVRKEQKDWGIAGDAGTAKRTIQVGMGDDMRFKPDRIEVRQGETVKFVVRNSGKLLHEFVIGTRTELEAHAALMVKFPGMEHDEPYMAHVAPGKTGEIVWTFNRAGEFEFACLIDGHFQAGMKGRIVVRAS
ncbi:MAG: cupredoxin family protein [Rubrivivax sp.]|nr:cupredoxin family protein [Rubrivivax sp.]